MFTGIIQSTANLINIDYNNNIYSIKTNLDLFDCKIGSSICCDGICLTAISIHKADLDYIFEVNVSEETIKRSNIIDWIIGSKINIEKSLKMGDEISGHFVYGHVDLAIPVSKIIEFQNSWEFEFTFSSHHNSLDFKKYIIEKGSLAINGISLTVANVFENSFNVSIIPHTYEITNLPILKLGDKVNIEFDPLDRYISNRYEK